ncbi:hypothetical protein ACFSTE_02835 [Aquimarina hainanensis]|uniref:Uncharacterized protein n=1 Tax=Aquimarina hainanensis TaxID=1578017 RepID=A0ABW5N6I3_9FLAO|nr:hypothetical protein [Aquimarina sp. TRL1]QKX05797.1 hypothetical protein HN014_13065 [Aquimarina sp. TRL1]
MATTIILKSNPDTQISCPSPIVSAPERKFISSTGNRSIFITFSYDKTSYGAVSRVGTQQLILHHQNNSRYFVYKQDQKHKVIYRKEETTIATGVLYNGKTTTTKEVTEIIEHIYEVKRTPIKFPLTDWEVFEKEELILIEKKVLKRSNKPQRISLGNTPEDYREYVAAVTSFVATGYQGEALSVAEAFDKKLLQPVASVSDAATVISTVAAAWGVRTKNPVIATAGTVSSIVGGATWIIMYKGMGLSPQDLVFLFPNYDYDIYPTGTYSNHYLNKSSMLNTPKWGIKS